MERYSLHVMVMLALLCSVGCTDVSQAVDEPGETRVAIVLKALLLAPATRAQGDIQSVQFDQGETINAYFSSGATLTENTYTTADANGTLTPVVVPYFDLTDNSAVVHAYYPSTYHHTSASFTVANDQTAAAGYKASDLMYATTTVAKGTLGTSTGTLTFNHKMAKVALTVTAGTGLTAVTQVRIVGGSRTVSVTDPLTCTLGNELSDTIDDTDEGCLKLYENATGAASVTCFALIPPQSVSGDFLEVTLKNASGQLFTTTYSLVSSAFSSGKVYAHSITVRLADIGLTHMITDWGAGTSYLFVWNGKNNLEGIDMGSLADNGKRLLWASYNLGAESPDENGLFFEWGQTTGYLQTDAANRWPFAVWNPAYAVYYVEQGAYSYDQGSTPIYYQKYSKYVTTAAQENYWGGQGDADNLTTLLPEDDAATVNWGSPWRMPTATEYGRLISACDITQISDYEPVWQEGNGLLFVSRTTGNSLYFKAVGYATNGGIATHNEFVRYWTSSLVEYAPDNAYGLKVNFTKEGNGVNRTGTDYRYYGFPVRAVREVDN